MHHVEFQPSGRRASIEPGTSLLEAARRAGVPIESICSGAGTCGKCIVRVLEGECAGLTDSDTTCSHDAESLTGHRLACRTTALSDLKVYVPRATAAKAQRLQLLGVEWDVTVDSPIGKVRLDVDAPSFTDLRSDASRVIDAYRGRTNAGSLLLDSAALRDVTPALRDGRNTITVVTYGGAELISIRPGDTEDRRLGAAVDLGTTKVAAYLVDLVSGCTLDSVGAMNPQVAYGEDVVSRAAYIMSHDDGDSTLQSVSVDLLNLMIRDMCVRNGLTVTDVLDLVIVGNTAMHHILNRLPVRGLVRAPYVPATSDALNVKARDLGLNMASGGYTYWPPVVAGFVGPDHLAMLLAADLDHRADNTLAIDVGTNTEMSLATTDGAILCCSCASGPALEGGHIEFGMRAAPGAIEHVIVDERRGEAVVETIDGEPAVGICGSGVLEAVAALYRAGVVDRRGRLQGRASGVRPAMDTGIPEFVLVPRRACGLDEDIVLTQADVDAVLLAKGAIRTGIETLLGHAGMDACEISEFVVAGAFGTHIDTATAVAIGMFPEAATGRSVQIGNGAGSGAKMMLLSRAWRDKAVELASERIEYVELTTSVGFSRTFAHSLRLPDSRGL